MTLFHTPKTPFKFIDFPSKKKKLFFMTFWISISLKHGFQQFIRDSMGLNFFHFNIPNYLRFVVFNSSAIMYFNHVNSLHAG